MPKSEQWWELGIMQGAGDETPIRNTRSRKVRDRWLRDDLPGHQAVTYARERWTVGGRFDGECYAAGRIEVQDAR